jgi:hypothetical protein
VFQVNFGTKNKGKLICNSPNEIIYGNFDSEKLIKMEFFIIKIYYANKKSYLGLVIKLKTSIYLSN